MEDVLKIVEQTTKNMEMLLEKNNEILNILAKDEPQKADEMLQDMNATINAMKTGDLEKINELLGKYANYANK